MPPRARAILGSLVLAFATLAAPSPARAQRDPTTMTAAIAAATRPVENADDRPFRPGGEARDAANPSALRPRPTTSPSSLSSLGFDVGRMLSALVIVLALIGLAYWAARRLTGRVGGAQSTRAVKVLSRTPLAPRQQVVLLQVGRRVIVVGESAGQLAPLAQIDDADEVAQLLGQIEGDHARRAASTFGGVFRRSQASFDEPAVEQSPADVEPATHELPAPVGDLDQQRSELSSLLDKVRALRGQIDK